MDQQTLEVIALVVFIADGIVWLVRNLTGR